MASEKENVRGLRWETLKGDGSFHGLLRAMASPRNAYGVDFCGGEDFVEGGGVANRLVRRPLRGTRAMAFAEVATEPTGMPEASRNS